jgi:hypothetical protein
MEKRKITNKATKIFAGNESTKRMKRYSGNPFWAIFV